MNKKFISYIFIIPAVSLIILTIITPLFLMIRVSFLKPPEGTGFYIPNTFSFQNYQSVFDTYGVSIIINTIIFAFEVSFFSILLGFAFAIIMQKLTYLWRIIFIISLLLPKFISPLIVIFGLQRILGGHGIVNESLITRARNYCVDEFMRSDSTHMLFLDADIGFNANDVIAMLAMQSDESPYDVLAAPYPKKSIHKNAKILTEDGYKKIK